MAKGIIVVEMPENCSECLLRTASPGCSAVGKSIYRVIRDREKPDWCPVHPMPKKNAEKDYTPIRDKHYFDGYEDGWNDCVDYLEGRNGK